MKNKLIAKLSTLLITCGVYLMNKIIEEDGYAIGGMFLVPIEEAEKSNKVDLKIVE